MLSPEAPSRPRSHGGDLLSRKPEESHATLAAGLPFLEAPESMSGRATCDHYKSERPHLSLPSSHQLPFSRLSTALSLYKPSD